MIQEEDIIEEGMMQEEGILEGRDHVERSTI